MTTPAARSDLAALYRRWIDDAWAGDESATRAIVADDFVGHWPDRDVVGPDALVEAIGAGYAMVPDLTIGSVLGPFVVDDPGTDGDVVVGRWEGRGTMPDGSAVRFVGNDILRIRDGRIVEYWNAAATST